METSKFLPAIAHIKRKNLCLNEKSFVQTIKFRVGSFQL